MHKQSDMTGVVRHRFTVDEYLRMAKAGVLEDARVELLRGEIIEMSPIGSPHASHVTRIDRFFQRLGGDHFMVRCQCPTIVEEHSVPEPDLALVKWRDDYYAKRHPTPEDVLLLVEVSDSSVDKDRRLKLSLYAEAGIPEYWIVDVTRKVVEVYRQPSGDRYEESFELQSGQKLELVGLEGVKMELADILG